VVFDKTFADGVEEIPVQAGVHEAYDYFRDTVPVIINGDKAMREWMTLVTRSGLVLQVEYLQLAWGRVEMSRDPDAKDGDVDASDQDSDAPFDSNGCLLLLHNNGDSIDDDLHKKLDLCG